MKDCNKCIHTRLVMSENGHHSVCTLSPKAARDCLLGKNDRYRTLDEWDRKEKEK